MFTISSIPLYQKALRLLILALTLFGLALLQGIFAVDFASNMSELARQLNLGVRLCAFPLSIIFSTGLIRLVIESTIAIGKPRRWQDSQPLSCQLRHPLLQRAL